MAVIEIFSYPEVRRYKAHFCSKATFFIIFIFLVTFIAPFFVVYKSYGFWKKTDYYEEKLDVSFQHKLIVILETEKSYVAWSTFSNFNKMQQNQLRIPMIKSREVDQNGDGSIDYLHINIQMPLTDAEQIYGVKLLLFFRCALWRYQFFKMQSLGYVNYESRRPGAKFNTYADLKFVQKQPLKHHGSDNRFNALPIDEKSPSADAFDFEKIFYTYAQRNVSTVIENRYPVWIAGRGSGQPFLINTTITYPTPYIQYYTGFWQTLKWGVIQYIPILIIFILAFSHVKWFVFENQLFPCIVERPFKTNYE